MSYCNYDCEIVHTHYPHHHHQNTDYLLNEEESIRDLTSHDKVLVSDFSITELMFKYRWHSSDIRKYFVAWEICLKIATTVDAQTKETAQNNLANKAYWDKIVNGPKEVSGNLAAKALLAVDATWKSKADYYYWVATSSILSPKFIV